MPLCAGAQGWGRKVPVGRKLGDRRRDLSALSWQTAGIYVVESDPSLILSLLCDVGLLEEVSVLPFYSSA